MPSRPSRPSSTGSLRSPCNSDITCDLGAFRIIEERTVGPSLGLDSIISGSRSALYGMIVVIIFMLIYYKFSGGLADLALTLNIIFIMAVMAYFNATLTLPGIAGIILTIGMAVDANVLIFERFFLRAFCSTALIARG